MNNLYTFSEQVDMILVYGFCRENACESVRVYRERYPNRRVPNRKTFSKVVRRARETGSLKAPVGGRGRPRSARTAELEEIILDNVAENPTKSCRIIALEENTNKSTVNRVTREQFLHPFHVQLVQEILPEDTAARVRFCNFILRRPLNFIKKILFSDEAIFSRRGVTNMHNSHVYSDENPHAIENRSFQREFRVNVWLGIIDSLVIGPVFLPERLNGDNYLEFLRDELPLLLEDLPLITRNRMWFMHDGAPPHFSRQVRLHLHQQFANRWIGRGDDAPVSWPPRSPDMNPCDFYLWGHMKNLVYAEPIETREQLVVRIENAAERIRNNVEVLRKIPFNFRKRMRLCLRENGYQFQQLM